MQRSVIALFVICLAAGHVLAADETAPSSSGAGGKPGETKPAPPADLGVVTDPSATDKPGAYRPPPPGKRIAGGRVGGGTRATRTANCGVKVNVVAPSDHVGLTLEAQPTLYFLLSGDTRCPVEFVLNDRRQVPPLVEGAVKTSTGAGLHAVRLSDFGVTLEPDVEYDWYVQVKALSDSPVPDAYSGGQVRRVAATGLPAVDTLAPGRARSRALANGSIWYDSVAALSAEIEAAPTDAALRQERAALLESVGLVDVPESDARTPTP